MIKFKIVFNLNTSIILILYHSYHKHFPPLFTEKEVGFKTVFVLHFLLRLFGINNISNLIGWFHYYWIKSNKGHIDGKPFTKEGSRKYRNKPDSNTQRGGFQCNVITNEYPDPFNTKSRYTSNVAIGGASVV